MKVEIFNGAYARTDIGGSVSGTVDMLSDFAEVDLRTIDIALLMCYDKKQKVVATN